MKRKKKQKNLEWFEKPFPTELKAVLAILIILVFFNEPWFIPVLCIMGIGALITLSAAVGVVPVIATAVVVITIAVL